MSYYFKNEKTKAQRILKAFPRPTISKVTANENASYSGFKVPVLLAAMLRNDNVK